MRDDDAGRASASEAARSLDGTLAQARDQLLRMHALLNEMRTRLHATMAVGGLAALGCLALCVYALAEMTGHVRPRDQTEGPVTLMLGTFMLVAAIAFVNARTRSIAPLTIMLRAETERLKASTMRAEADMRATIERRAHERGEAERASPPGEPAA